MEGEYVTGGAAGGGSDSSEEEEPTDLVIVPAHPVDLATWGNATDIWAHCQY